MKKNIFIVLTGGPGGGKSTLIEELRCDQDWSGRIAVLPEAIFLMRQIGVSPCEPIFQRVMVSLQMALEDGLVSAFGQAEPRVILCHRGSLDPLAYWLDRSWPEEEFFTFTGTRKEEHYRRYSAVIHLVTAANGAAEYYTNWPEAHRPEGMEDSIRLDRLLHKVWCDHPNYYRLDNNGKDWADKSQAAHKILANLMVDRLVAGDR